MHFGLHLLLHFLIRTVGRSVAEFLLRPFLGFLDGSDEPAGPQPLYSIAEARRKQGRYLEARELVLAQLAQFPEDYRGQMMLAEIEAVDFHDLQSAETAIQTLVAQKCHPPATVFSALCTLADWQLRYARDNEAACRCFEHIIARFPESEWALRAAQRIAHLPTTAMLTRDASEAPIQLTHFEADRGLAPQATAHAREEKDPTAEAARLVERLDDFPLDWEAREDLVLLYARDFHRLDLAESQIEQLIQFPNQPARQIVRWLNMLADLHVKHGGTYETAASALERIIAMNPAASAAHVAQSRLERLRLEFKGQEKSQAATLGSYEDDLGLKNRTTR